MSDIGIGDWVQRETGRSTLGHLVESLVADDVVTRCGRRMTRHATANAGPLVVIDRPLKCFICK